MKKIAFKIIASLFIVFLITTSIPRLYFFYNDDIPYHDILTSSAFLWGMALTAGFALVLFAAMMNYIIIHRIKNLSDATQRVAKGDFEGRIECKGADELSVLTKNFNQMVASLKANEYLNKEFVRNFSHELKTPISAIQGYAELMMMGTLSKNEVDEYAKIIAIESKRLTELSKSMLQISMLDSTEIVKKDNQFNVAEQIRNVIQIMQLEWEEKNIEFDLSLEEVKIKSNKELTYEIWQNLIQNAIRYSYKNGKIELSLKAVDNLLIFEVIDHGIGIAKAEFEQIFNLFYVSDRSRTAVSNGVGLSITKKIVEKLGGEIAFDSIPETKTVFTVRLPLNQ